MDSCITRAEHEEFTKRMEAEHTRQNRRIELLEENVERLGRITSSVERLATNIEGMLKEQERQGERLEAAGMPARQGTVARGVYKGFRTDPTADYYCNSGTQSPSMLIELGFVSSPEDNDRFDRDYEKYCSAIVQAACEYLGVNYIPVQEKPEGNNSDKENFIYRVQVGAFSVEDNAKNQAKELESKGYKTIIKKDQL